MAAQENTVIHGTFASGAEWTQEGSEFREKLRSHLGTNPGIFVFEWSGGNSHQARIQAGEELEGFLQKLIERFPFSRHTIVAHSHGGNVACYALKNAGIREKISSLITLGTPFIACRPREMPKFMAHLALVLTPGLALPLTVLIAVTTYFLIKYVFQYFNQRNPYYSYGFADFEGKDGWGFIVSFGIVYVLVPVVFFLLAKIISRYLKARPDKLQPRQSRIKQRLELPGLDSVRIFSIAIDRDEAGLLLGYLHYLANRPAIFFKRCEDLLEKLGVHREGFGEKNHWFFYVGLFLIFMGVVPFFGDGWEAIMLLPSTTFLGLWGLAIVLTFMAMILSQIFMAVIPKLIRSHPLGFGGESVFDNWLMDIHAVENPADAFRLEKGNCTFLRFKAPALEVPAQSSSLKHSQLYRSEKVIKTIVDWLNGVLPVKSVHVEVSKKNKTEPLFKKITIILSASLIAVVGVIWIIEIRATEAQLYNARHNIEGYERYLEWSNERHENWFYATFTPIKENQAMCELMLPGEKYEQAIEQKDVKTLCELLYKYPDNYHASQALPLVRKSSEQKYVTYARAAGIAPEAIRTIQAVVSFYSGPPVVEGKMHIPRSPICSFRLMV